MAGQNGSVRVIGGKRYILKPRDYVVDIVHDAVAGSNATGFINIDPSSPFILTDKHMSDTVDPSLAAPGLQGQYENKISVQDGNGYNWSNDYVSRSGFARDRARGYRMPEEMIIQANTKLTINLRNPAAGAAVGTTSITLTGFSVYPESI